MKKPFKIVKIKWSDSNRYLEQGAIDDTYEVAIMETVGWWIADTKKAFVLAQDIVGTDCRGVIVIPLDNVKDFECIKE